MFNLRALRYMTPFLMRDIDEIYEVFDGDPWPYGLEPNRPTLEAFVTYLTDQSLIAAPVPVDDLFVPTLTSAAEQGALPVYRPGCTSARVGSTMSNLDVTSFKIWSSPTVSSRERRWWTPTAT